MLRSEIASLVMLQTNRQKICMKPSLPSLPSLPHLRTRTQSLPSLFPLSAYLVLPTYISLQAYVPTYKGLVFMDCQPCTWARRS
jgi:hypothetical protein